MIDVWLILLCWILGAAILQVAGNGLDRPKKGLNLYLHPSHLGMQLKDPVYKILCTPT